mmetsp:Transcript_46012/g.49635  ORF Transcript_46012/g.49635 Transcript_46012/m.49635 type:complete len:99 (-) Transcript_46012:58-354(-)
MTSSLFGIMTRVCDICTFSFPAIIGMNGILCVQIITTTTAQEFFSKKREYHTLPIFVKIVKTNSSLIGACYTAVLYLEQFIFSHRFGDIYFVFKSLFL